MQILGKRSKLLLIVIAIVMLVAVGVSVATWDISAVKATSEGLSAYANAKVGDVIEFGRYYQTGIKDETTGEYEKTPIEWLVVDKDERSGQLTLMSKYILAAGCYFGNWYYNTSEIGDWHYNTDRIEIAGNQYNQAYVESTVRAYLNNLERRDLGGDGFDGDVYKTSLVLSNMTIGKLNTSVGFSNRKYYFNNIEYQRPITNEEYRKRPATRGFYDEAFSDDEKALIAPKVIPGYIGHRWPNNLNDVSKMMYVEGVVDKVWIPSATELNAMSTNELYTNPSDEASSTVFEYFKKLSDLALQDALKSVRSDFLKNNSKAMNYSIPIYQFQSLEINEDIHETLNSLDYYWTRSPMTNNHYNIRRVNGSGAFYHNSTHYSNVGVRPCVILKY